MYQTYVVGSDAPDPPRGVPGTVRYITQSACESSDDTKIAGTTTNIPNNCIPLGDSSSLNYAVTACTNFGIQTYHYTDADCSDQIPDMPGSFNNLIPTSTCTLDPVTKSYLATFGCPGTTFPPYTGAIAGTITASIMQASGENADCTADGVVAEYMQTYGRCENNYD